MKPANSTINRPVDSAAVHTTFVHDGEGVEIVLVEQRLQLPDPGLGTDGHGRRSHDRADPVMLDSPRHMRDLLYLDIVINSNPLRSSGHDGTRRVSASHEVS